MPAFRKVVITGGAGFLGRALIPELMAAEYAVTVFDNEAVCPLTTATALGATPWRGDVRDFDAVLACFSGADAVIHLAADSRVMDSLENPRFNFENNVVGTFNVLEACRLQGVGRLINASTGGAILGEAEPPVHEEMLPRPLAPYGASKLAAEAYCGAYASAYGLACASLRFTNIYGPDSLHKRSVVAHFFKAILAGEPLVVYGDGSQCRDYLYIGDVAKGIVQALEAGVEGTFQLGGGQPTSLNQLIDGMRAAVGPGHVVEVRYEDFRRGEVRSTWATIDKARRAFGFAPTTSLEAGLGRTWAWYRAQAGRGV
ncbi:NAD(P)-dependent oxidoreductase [Magnetospirillum sp. UT-4]|uniref:NAD-dependent epimerase/dehydratase family protein n=1 Tax=Magnetospirillum sp. UT-4 TaxID=2681467 RepID=UPI0013864030|nr:NAD-dependent epimerase/dehydratase family protein [Magnetospirillum sp. UT-4]CAA7612128.1 NAD-dependent epimerase/dehydratase [Magnetospirillum sp. UT-4]